MQPDLTEILLKYIENRESVDTYDLVTILNVDHQKIVGAVNSILSTGELINSVPVSRKSWELTDEGKQFTVNGSHEACVYNSVPADGIPQAELMKVVLIFVALFSFIT